MVPNHWHISIRRVPLQPPGHIVFIVQPESRYVDTQAPIETVMGKALGDSIDLESEAATLVVVRLILQAFVDRSPTTGKPWSWCINDEAMATRILGIMRRLNVDESLVDMPLASDEQNALSDERWERFMRQLGALTS